MSTDAPHTPKFSVFERVLAYAAIAIMVIAVAAYITTLIVGMVAGRQALAGSLWPVVVGISYVGLPVGFVLLMVLLGMSYAKRGRRSERS